MYCATGSKEKKKKGRVPNGRKPYIYIMNHDDGNGKIKKNLLFGLVYPRQLGNG